MRVAFVWLTLPWAKSDLNLLSKVGLYIYCLALTFQQRIILKSWLLLVGICNSTIFEQFYFASAALTTRTETESLMKADTGRDSKSFVLIEVGGLSPTIYVLSLSPRFNGHFPGEPRLAGVYWSKGWWSQWWQLDYWSYKSYKAPVKSSPPTNQHPVFYRLDALPVTHPTVSKHVTGKYVALHDCITVRKRDVSYLCCVWQWFCRRLVRVLLR